MTSKKILLLSVSAGAGHTRAAEAIRAYAQLHGANVSATHVDVMDYVPAAFRKLYVDLYIRIVTRYPSIWRRVYDATDQVQPNTLMPKLRRLIERLNTRRLVHQIVAASPDAIICTHFMPAEILSHLAKKANIRCPVWVQVTDFDLHGMWVQRHVAGYFAASDNVAARLRAQGIAAANIHVTGIPIMPAFRQQLCRLQCAAHFGLDPARPIVLLMGGGAGLGRLDEVARTLLALPTDYQLVVLAGRNKAMLAALQDLAILHPRRLLALGFTDQIAPLMACAAMVVTKPGGLTASECLAMGLPMILNDPIPGHEERNADYLVGQGAALKASNATTLASQVAQLLANPAQLARMRRCAQMLGKPVAADDVLDTVLAHVQPA